MSRQRQSATGRNREAANTQKLRHHFTETAKRVELEFIRFAAWLRMAWG